MFARTLLHRQFFQLVKISLRNFSPNITLRKPNNSHYTPIQNDVYRCQSEEDNLKSLNTSDHTSERILFIETMKDFDFDESDCLHIISIDPQVLNLPSHEVRLSLKRWNHSQLGCEQVKLLMLNNPSYLFVPLLIVEKRLALLQGLTNPKVLATLLMQCPNVMTEQWEQIESKIEYLTRVMCVEKSEVLKCKALGKTLEKIKMRHQLLKLCGLYVAPSAYEHKRVKNEKSAFKNPPLKRIVDNEDISFARKICKISHEEFEAFSEIFTQLMEKEMEDELVSDSESDSDD